MTVTPRLLASRVRLIGSCVCLVFLCSCITMPRWFAESSQRPILPAEASFTKVNGAAGSGGNLFLTLRLDTGEELLFLVDTGSPLTVLDKSLDRQLGRRVGTAEVFYAYYERRIRRGVHHAPKLFLGTTRLQTSKWVVVDDLSRMAGGLPARGSWAWTACATTAFNSISLPAKCASLILIIRAVKTWEGHFRLPFLVGRAKSSFTKILSV